jgi:hypothetical protein
VPLLEAAAAVLLLLLLLLLPLLLAGVVGKLWQLPTCLAIQAQNRLPHANPFGPCILSSSMQCYNIHWGIHLHLPPVVGIYQHTQAVKGLGVKF